MLLVVMHFLIEEKMVVIIVMVHQTMVNIIELFKKQHTQHHILLQIHNDYKFLTTGQRAIMHLYVLSLFVHVLFDKCLLVVHIRICMCMCI